MAFDNKKTHAILGLDREAIVMPKQKFILCNKAEFVLIAIIFYKTCLGYLRKNPTQNDSFPCLYT